MEQLALYAQPTYAKNQLVEVNIDDTWVRARIEGGTQSLEDGSWQYTLRLRVTYDEVDSTKDGRDLGYISLGGRWNAATSFMRAIFRDDII